MILGEGGMAVVHKVWQPELERWVAVKRCKNPQDLPAFQQEAKLMAALKHPALAQIHALQNDELIMEFIPGQTLRDATIDAHHLLEQLLDVLEYLHGEHVILKDLKPENIMVEPSQKIRVLDLGIAKRLEQGTQLLLKGVGSEYYAPPEQYGHGSTDQRSDFYSLGATLYFCLTRQDPTPAWQRMAKGTHLEAPGPLHHLIQELTQLKPQDRPENVQAIRRLLRPLPPKERPRPATPEIAEKRSYNDHGLLAWNDEGLWVANQTLHLLGRPQEYKPNQQPTHLKAQQNKIALATKDRLHLKEKGQWSEHKISVKDLALSKDVLILTHHLEFHKSKLRFPTGWGKRYSVCAADETHVAAGGSSIKVWDAGGTPLWEDQQPAQKLQFHGPFLFSAQKDQVTVYQSDTGKRLSHIKAPTFQQIHLTDRYLIGIQQHNISLWDYTQGHQLLTIDLPDPIVASAMHKELAVSTSDKIWVLTFSH